MPLEKLISILSAQLVADNAPEGAGDDELHSTYPKPPHYRPAAVLVPLVLVDNDVHVILTERAADLQHHPGQIGFPGGRVEDSDKNLVDTALREAHEEIGLDASLVSVLGHLPSYPTRSGFMITPVVGVLTHLPPLVPDASEVAAIFTVPLDHFVNADNRRIDQITSADYTHQFYAYDTPHGLVWGATAGILVNLARLLG